MVEGGVTRTGVLDRLEILWRKLEDEGMYVRANTASLAIDEIKRREEMDWQPIETAPKDGTRFLTWDSHYGVRIGRAFVRSGHDDWLSIMDAYGGSSKGGIRPTHWRPQPASPLQ